MATESRSFISMAYGTAAGLAAGTFGGILLTAALRRSELKQIYEQCLDECRQQGYTGEALEKCATECLVNRALDHVLLDSFKLGGVIAAAAGLTVTGISAAKREPRVRTLGISAGLGMLAAGGLLFSLYLAKSRPAKKSLTAMLIRRLIVSVARS